MLLRSKTENNVLKDWRDIPSLKLLNLVYDATPPQFISIVITEVSLTNVILLKEVQTQSILLNSTTHFCQFLNLSFYQLYLLNLIL